MRVPMWTRQFFVFFWTPYNRTNLRSSINAVQQVARRRIPNSYVPILTATTRGQSSRLPRTKGHGLNGCLVITKSMNGSRDIPVIPNMYQVIISTRSQEMGIGLGWPCHTWNLGWTSDCITFESFPKQFKKLQLSKILSFIITIWRILYPHNAMYVSMP